MTGYANNDVCVFGWDDWDFIVGVASHDKNIHDSKTLNVAISHANSNRNKPTQTQRQLILHFIRLDYKDSQFCT